MSSAAGLWRAVLGALSAAVLLGSSAMVSVAGAQAERGAVSGLAAAAGGAGELVVTWQAPSDPGALPTSYRLDWALEGEHFRSWRVDEGHLFPSGESTQATVGGLVPSGSYMVRLRARYHSGGFERAPWSGPWSQTARAIQAGADPENGADVEPESDIGPDVEDGSKTQPESEAESEGESETGSEPEGKPESAPVPEEIGIGAVLEGTLEVGTGSSLPWGGYVGFSHWGSTGSLVESFVDGSLASVFVKSLVWMGGEGRAVRGHDGLAAPVVLVVREPLGSPFVLWVGDRRFVSSEALVPAGEATSQTHYWIWERRCPGWADGDVLDVGIELLADGDERLAGAANTSLGSLAVRGAVLREPFDPSAADYVADAGIGTAMVTVDAEAAPGACGVDIAPADTDPVAAGHQLKLAADGAVATVTVTAPGGAQRTHTLTVTRGGRGPAALTGLEMSGTPDMGFEPAQRRYQTSTRAASVRIDAAAAADAQVDITAVRSDDPASIHEASEGTVGLASGGDTTVIVRATTADARSETLYVARLRSPSSSRSSTEPVSLARSPTGPSSALAAAVKDAEGVATQRSDDPAPRLEGLAVNPGPLAPVFDTATLDYAVAVNNTVAHITVTPLTPTGATAAITRSDADPDTPGHQVALNAIAEGNSSSQTAIAVVVTSGAQQQTYTVTVTRAAPLGTVTMELPQGCTLRDLGVGDESQVTLDGIEYHQTRSYSWNNGCPSLIRSQDQRNAEYFRLVLSQETEISLRLHGTHSSHLVIRSASGDILAHDGLLDLAAQRPYIPLLTRTLPRGTYLLEAASHWYHWNFWLYLQYSGPGIVRFAHELTGLSISDVNLSAFASDVFDYARNVAGDVSTVTVSPTTPPGAQVQILPADADPSTLAHDVSIVADGVTEIAVTVGSPLVDSGGGTYRVSLTRLEGTTAPLSDDGGLASLAFEGLDIGEFSPSVTDYTFVPGFYQRFNTATTTLMLATAHPGATWTLNRDDTDPDTDGLQFAVSDGSRSKPYVITVTSQDGANTRVYTVRPQLSLTKDPARRIALGDGSTPRALWADGRSLIAVTDSGYQVFDAGTWQRSETFRLPRPPGGRGERGFWSDGETMWVLYLEHDYGPLRHENNLLFAFSHATRERTPEKDIYLPDYPGSYQSFWTDGETLYLHTSWRDLFVFDFAIGERLEKDDLRREIELEGRGTRCCGSMSGFNRGRHMWSDGTTLWIVLRSYQTFWHEPPHAGWVWAYDLESGRRVTGLDFHVPLSVHRRGPKSLWSDGRTMWVGTEDRLHAYLLPENARLSSLSVSGAEMEFFYNGKFSYNAVVPTGTTSTTVVATPAFESSTVTMDVPDADPDADGHQVALDAVTVTVVTVTVTAPNGTDTEVYTVSVSAAAEGGSS